jgi:hypothetical protein
MASKKIIAALLALLLLAGAVLGTGCKSSPAVITLGSVTVTEDVYTYWLSCYKYLYLSRYMDLGIRDTEEGWGEIYREGKSYGEVFRDSIEQDLRRRIAAAALFDANGLSLSAAARQEIAAKMDDVFYYEENADRNAAFGKYGTDEAGARQVAVLETKYDLYFTALFGSDQSKIYDEVYREEADAYYEKNVRRVKVIFVPKGTDCADLSDAMSTMTERDFEYYAEKYNDDEMLDLSEFPDGLYLLDDADYNRSSLIEFPEMLQIALRAKERECLSTATAEGTYFVYRCMLPEDGYRDEANAEMLSEFAYYCAHSIYLDHLNEKLKEITVLPECPALPMHEILTNREYNVVAMIGN